MSKVLRPVVVNSDVVLTRIAGKKSVGKLIVATTPSDSPTQLRAKDPQCRMAPVSLRKGAEQGDKKDFDVRHRRTAILT